MVINLIPMDIPFAKEEMPPPPRELKADLPAGLGSAVGTGPNCSVSQGFVPVPRTNKTHVCLPIIEKDICIPYICLYLYFSAV